jgi:hypothetical protein
MFTFQYILGANGPCIPTQLFYLINQCILLVFTSQTTHLLKLHCIATVVSNKFQAAIPESLPYIKLLWNLRMVTGLSEISYPLHTMREQV